MFEGTVKKTNKKTMLTSEAEYEALHNVLILIF